MTYLGERGDPRHEFIAMRDQCVDLDERSDRKKPFELADLWAVVPEVDNGNGSLQQGDDLRCQLPDRLGVGIGPTVTAREDRAEEAIERSCLR